MEGVTPLRYPPEGRRISRVAQGVDRGIRQRRFIVPTRYFP